MIINDSLQGPKLGLSPTLSRVLTSSAEEKSTSSLFHATIPVVDLNDFKSYDQKTRQKFIDELGKALQEVGFVAVLNPGVNQKVLDEGYKSIEKFFNLSKKEKMALNAPHLGGQRGYSPGESAKGESTGDFKEFFHVGSELSDLGNIWPESMDLKNPLSELFKELQGHSIPIQQAIAAAIGESEDFFTSRTEKGEPLLRALHYPANPPKEQPLAAAHTDIDLFTILPKATERGLQVKNKEGQWVDVLVPENSFIINAGDMLQNITNGKIKSCEHRVIANESDKERYSMVLFIHPRSDVKLDPLPKCIVKTGGVAKYPNATRWELLIERLADLGLASDDMLKQLGECGLMERMIELGRASFKAMDAVVKAGYASETVKEWEKNNNQTK